MDDLLLKIHASSSNVEVSSAKALLEQKLLKEPREKLLERMKRSSDKVEIEAVEFALWRKEIDESFEGLLHIINTSSDEARIREAAIVLGDKGYKGAVLPLIDLLVHTSNSMIRDGGREKKKLIHIS